MPINSSPFLYIRSNEGFNKTSLLVDIPIIEVELYEDIFSQRFENYEIKTGKKAACIEEIAYKMGYIDLSQLKKIAN